MASRIIASKLQTTDRAMIRWICGVKVKDRVRSDVLLQKLMIPCITEVCRANRLRCFGHVERSNSWIKRCTEMVVDGNVRPGGQRKKWISVVNQGMEVVGVKIEDAQDRTKWRHEIHKQVRKNYHTNST